MKPHPRVGTKIVEPRFIPCSGGVDKVETETGFCVISVQDVHLGSNLRIGDVSALQGIVLGDDVDYVGSEHELYIFSKGGMASYTQQGL